MESMKTKSLERIEQKMQDIDKGSFRYQVLEGVKKFKTSWITLGQALYAVSKDKMYKDWGFLTFEAYITKEIGIQKQTALKLLKSYYFLEKNEPTYLDKGYIESGAATALPNYESINVLRLAKNRKELSEKDYENLKKDVLENGKEARDVRKELTTLIRQREDLTPEEARKKREMAALKRFLSTLKSLRKDLGISKLVSVGILKETDALIKKIEGEIEK